MKFKELPLHPEVMKGITAAGFTDCMPVQEKVLPGALAGKDVMAQSKTGSGKTAVFLITLLQKYVVAREAAQQHPDTTDLPVALIVAPTRELAVQIEEDARLLASGIPNFRIGCFYGGVGYAKQDRQLTEGVDLIIGTPGRMLDYQKMGKLNFKSINTFVIDEADRLFDMGFYPDIQKMFRLMVKRENRQTMLFSATLGTRVRNLAWDYMNEPIEIEVQPEEITVKLITQELFHVSKEEKFDLFLRLMTKEDPQNALIFTNTKAKAVEISKRLNVNGYTTQYLMGDLPQSKRLQVINRMKSGELRFLVATDVAARGLQIDDLQLVVNYDIPEDYESYVHRIGRTARAGKSGKAVTLACEQYVYGLEAIEDYIQMKIPVIWPDEATLPRVEDKSAKMRFRDLVSEQEFASRRNATRGPKGKGRAKLGTTPGRGAKRPAKKQPKQQNEGKEQPKRSGEPPRKRPAQLAAKRSSPPAGKRSQRKTKSYQEIQKMDFEERIAYYKESYAAEGNSENKPNNNKPRSKTNTRTPSTGTTPQKRQDAVKKVPKTDEQKHTETSVPAAQKPQKKRGLLARLLKRVKGDA
jgi:ATP-dependent RNA helicase RhlB